MCNWQSLQVVIGFLLCFTVSGQGCGSNSPLIGKSAELTLTTDGVSGVVTVLSDCTFQASMFNAESGAPKFFWWGSNTSDTGTGMRVVDQQLSTSGYSAATLQFTLIQGISWNSFKYLAIWCEEFKAIIAIINLNDLSSTMTISATTTANIAPSPTPNMAAATSNFDNCITLMPGVFNLHWSVFKNTSAIEFGMEFAGANITWAAFGLSDPAVTTASMINSNPTVVGAHPSTPNGTFVLDYFLSSRSQCDYATNQGVCPRANNNDESLSLISASYDSVTRTRLIRYRRSLSGTKDYAYTLNGPVPAVWAMGPLSQDDTKPVLLYHGATHSPSTFTMNFAQPANMCGALAFAGQPGTNSSIPRYVNATSLLFTTGPNPNYPNPPGWGLSYYVNGVESPTLRVVRGTAYTITVQAPGHPVYLTSSMLGGKSGLTKTNETVYWGDSGVAAGDNVKPYVGTWTPDANTPNALFFQCYVHQKLGWKIEVTDAEKGAKTSGARIGLDCATAILFLAAFSVKFL